MTTYLKHIFALVAALVFAGCDLLGDLDFLPGKPDGGDDAPAEEAFRSVRGDFDGFDELVYNDDTLICYRESDAGLPEAMFIFTNDGDEEVAEMVYFDGDGIPVYFNVNGESIYVENIRGELCDLVILSDDGTFSTIPDVATGFDIANYWSEHPATRADGSNVANGVNMANRVLGARYFAEGSFGMGLGAFGMLVGCAMLVPGCNVVVGATLMIGSAVGFVASSMQIARATDLLVSDGSHTDGAYIATAEALGIISNVFGTPAVAAANILIDRGFGAVYDELDRRSQEQERLKQSRSVQSLTLTTGSADVDYCNRSARLSGSLSSAMSSDDRVGILISEDPSGLHVVACYDTEASAGEFEFEFSDLERCKSYFYRSYYVSESEQRSYVSKCREFYVPGVRTAGYTQLSEGRYEVILEAMLGDKLASADVGICYSSDNSEPTIEDDYTDPCEVSRTDSYTFTIECEELPCYYRAFMIVEEGIIYGATRSIYADERDILVKFYEDTGGDKWRRNDNWCSDLPLDDWYGVETNDEGRVVGFWLVENNLSGGGSLSGLDALERLELYNYDISGPGFNQLTTLDVSGCTALEYLYCWDNQLTTLDVSGCTALEGLGCYNNQLTTLDVSGCTALVGLACEYNQLTTLDVSGCTSLEDLRCEYNQLTTLVVSGCTALERLECHYNQLTTLDVSGFTALERLDCENNQFTTLDVSGCTALVSFSYKNGQLTTLDVSGCTSLERLECYSNQLTTLDVSGCTSLEELWCGSNQLTTLDVSDFAALENLSCSGNQLTTLDVLGCTSLEELYCRENQLTTLDVSGCTSLEELYCSENQLTTLDVSGCTSLDSFSYTNGQLTTLDVSGCTALERLECYSNQLTTLDVSGCTALELLWCSSNQLTTLDVSGCTALEYLYCWDNQLTTLDVSGLTALEELECLYNQLTTLDVSGCTALEELWCSGNQLATLDASSCTAMEYLECSDNQLTTLDVSGCTSLYYIDCSDNKITREISGIFAELDDFRYDRRYTYLGRDYDNNCWHWTDNGVGWWWPGEPHSGPPW